MAVSIWNVDDAGNLSAEPRSFSALLVDTVAPRRLAKRDWKSSAKCTSNSTAREGRRINRRAGPAPTSGLARFFGSSVYPFRILATGVYGESLRAETVVKNRFLL